MHGESERQTSNPPRPCPRSGCRAVLLAQVGTLVPVDPQAMFMSVVQLVLAPVILGTTLNQFFPRVRDTGACAQGAARAARRGEGGGLSLGKTCVNEVGGVLPAANGVLL